MVVQGAAQRSEQLASKMFDSGGFRETTIRDLMPRGGAGLKNNRSLSACALALNVRQVMRGTVTAAMKEFSLAEFGSSHVQARTLEDRMCEVGRFRFWLEKNNYTVSTSSGRSGTGEKNDPPRGRPTSMVVSAPLILCPARVIGSSLQTPQTLPDPMHRLNIWRGI